MRQWVRQSLFVGIVFISVWIMMVIYWQTSNTIPTSSEIVLFLFGIPFGLLFAVWLIRQGMGLFSATAVAALPSSQAQPADEALAKEQTTRHEREWTLRILASAISSAQGQSAEELADNLSSNETNLELDEELTDSNGFPILTGRVQELDEVSHSTALTSWLALQNLPEVTWSPEQLRAFTLGSDVLIELAQQVLTHPLLPAYISDQTEKRQTIPLPQIHLLAVLPVQWEVAKRKTMTEWFVHLIEEQGWPLEKIQISLLDIANPSDPLSAIDRFCVQTHRQTLPGLALLITCESYIGEATVTAWENAGSLFTGLNKNGLAPGEGAAGLLLADTEQATFFPLENQASIHRISSGLRDKSADSTGRISSEFLTQLVQDALTVANINADKITFIASDSDHRASRNAELMEMAYAVCPDLDLQTHCLKVATKCGSAGSATSITALSLAHLSAATDSTHALYVSNQDAFMRTAVVVSPIADATEHQIATT